jgi:hypothetical protein
VTQQMYNYDFSAMDAGMWTALDRVTRQPRLEYLAPSANLEEQPIFSLRMVSLDDSPLHEALSYVWGDPNITTRIQLCTVPRKSTTQ